MQELDIKRGHAKNVDLAALFDEHFGGHKTEKGPDGTWIVGSGPALKSFRCCIKGSKLLLDIAEDKGASMDDAMKAIKIKNTLLEAATGFTAKQRAKRAQDAAKKAGT